MAVSPALSFRTSARGPTWVGIIIGAEPGAEPRAAESSSLNHGQGNPSLEEAQTKGVGIYAELRAAGKHWGKVPSIEKDWILTKCNSKAEGGVASANIQPTTSNHGSLIALGIKLQWLIPGKGKSKGKCLQDLPTVPKFLYRVPLER